MIWAHITAIMLVGGLLLMFLGTVEGIALSQAAGFISFVTALVILFYGFREADN